MKNIKITPNLWFNKQAKEAAEYYVSVFTEGAKRFGGSSESKITSVTTLHNTPSGDSDIVSFTLLGQPYMAMSAGPFLKFNEAISFIIPCGNQAEIDYYWEKLSAVPDYEQCGWCKDKFGLSWQVTGARMEKMMKEGTQEQITRVTQAFLPMKKFDLATLERAYEGK